MKNVGVNTGTIIHSAKSDKKYRKKVKAFNKRYASECGECITRKASKEEIDAIINNLLDKH